MSKRVIKYCCKRFEEALLAAGERGMSIEVNYSPDLDAHCFVLTFRALDVKNEDTLLGGPDDLRICISTRQAIKHCPWCGKMLKKQYSRVYDQLNPTLGIFSTETEDHKDH